MGRTWFLSKVAAASAVAALVAGCSGERHPVTLTIDGLDYTVPTNQLSHFVRGGGPTPTKVGICMYSGRPPSAGYGDTFCWSFQVDQTLLETLATPATFRILGTASTVDSQPGMPSSAAPVWSYKADPGQSPEVLASFLEHRQSSAMWDGVQTQRLDGTLVIESAGQFDCDGRIDLDVVGALPPLDLNVERHAHLSGPFATGPSTL